MKWGTATGFRTRLTNHALIAAEVELSWEFDADFADLTEAVEGRRIGAVTSDGSRNGA